MGGCHSQTSLTKQRIVNWDEFFVALTKQYIASNGTQTASFNPKRIVFISIHGLFRSWKQCPPTSLFNALCILPLKSKWIRSPRDYDSVHSYSSLLQNEEFLCLLRWKLSQKLLFCALDTADDEQKGSAMQEQMNRYVSGECLVAPLWHKLSARLQALYDPINQRRYNPLILDEHYWLQRSSVSHRSHVHDMYTLKAESVILELYCATLKFKCVACILEESNPSLDAITAFQAPVVPAEKECNHTPLQPIMHAASAYSSPSIGVSIESSSPCYSDIDFGGAYLNAAHNKPYKAKNDCKGDDDDSNNKCDYCGNDDAAELIVMSGFVWIEHHRSQYFS